MKVTRNSELRAIRVPSAAPAISMRGAPNLPKMKTQLKKRLNTKEMIDVTSPSVACCTDRIKKQATRDVP